MNDTNDSKTFAIKSLAIVGFFALVALCFWLLVQGARIAPAAFSSLASIAESIQNYQPVTELSIATEKSIVNSGESTELSWTDMKQPGTYDFSYACVDGVTLQVRGGDGELISIPCMNKLSLPNDALGLFVSVTSEKSRFIDVPFFVSFTNDKGVPVIEQDAKLTVVNATIPLSSTLTDVRPTSELTKTILPPKTEEKPIPPKVPTQVASAVAGRPIVTEQVVSFIPQSYPNGFTDLKIRFIGVGNIEGTTFVPSATYESTVRNGFKFEIKNIGTKTSDVWTFTATLPSGVVYTSEPQTPLRPNESVEFTLGFTLDDTITAKSVTIKGLASEPTETNKANNAFTWSVAVAD